MKPAHLQNFKADINMCIEEQGKELINAVFPSFFYHTFIQIYGFMKTSKCILHLHNTFMKGVLQKKVYTLFYQN